MTASTFRLRIKVPRSVVVDGHENSREEFHFWIWDRLGPLGLLGIHEGTVLSEEAQTREFNTESWTVDSALAPRERDWIASQEIEDVELYFLTQEGAVEALNVFRNIQGIQLSTSVEEQVAEDWDAKWKASFTGVSVQPCWLILPPWVEAPKARMEGGTAGTKEILLRLNPGAGFGTGTHETTQLCLEALAGLGKMDGWHVLDFGSGSGILSIAAALLGAEVDAVEIDSLAIDNARENASLNQIESKIHFAKSLGTPTQRYQLIIANILKPVLLEFAPQLVERLMPDGALILSGLVESDVSVVAGRYSELLSGCSFRVNLLGEWRALLWTSDAYH